ncbi:MAG: aldo/keto reductase [Thioclava marina]|jgi:aryl-alcohol dehydrogenase-like predicted oxidoreductase|uniref:aldo/keto reductase n=1 Tax=Thioclava TaxID=285107 RepID=UPI000997E0FB|nr:MULTISPECIES: aldo/keto reductase [Thioclava]MBC7145959.1 aldo/keto reductase [Thioclava marina]OOY26815.1 aldo/keto reductase [Thioclava sp. L04-15]TNE93426.1 MAG: aldo/keto reductase [Paracoccaceae bacterium]
MRYKPLGPSGLLVSELCLGTMTFGGSEGMWRQIGQLRQDEADALVRTALDAGINFIDTANIYAGGESERILGQSLRNLGVARDEVVIATKVLGPMGEGINQRGASRYHIMEQCKASLSRLQLDHVDLYQIHGFDPMTPITETLEALDTLVRHGHIRYVGLSNWAAWQVMKAVGITEARKLAPILSLQSYYTIAGRDLERDIVPMLRDTGIGLMVWSPLAGGLLSGKYDRDGKGADGRRATFDFPPVEKDRAFDVIDAMRPIAEAKGVSVAQVALAWLLHQDVVTSVIVGAKRIDQLSDNIGATQITLDPEELATLDKVSALPAEYPGWMLERQGSYRAR